MEEDGEEEEEVGDKGGQRGEEDGGVILCERWPGTSSLKITSLEK